MYFALDDECRCATPQFRKTFRFEHHAHCVRCGGPTSNAPIGDSRFPSLRTSSEVPELSTRDDFEMSTICAAYRNARTSVKSAPCATSKSTRTRDVADRPRSECLVSPGRSSGVSADITKHDQKEQRLSDCTGLAHAVMS